MSTEETSKSLKGPGETRLTVLGCIEAELEYDGKSMKETLFVIKGQRHALLSRAACTTLGLVARVQTVNDSSSQPSPDFRAEFTSLFKGLGLIDLKYQYSISLKPDVQPVCIYTPQHLPPISLSMHVHGCYKLHFAFLTRTLGVLGVTIYNLKMGEMYMGKDFKRS